MAYDLVGIGNALVDIEVQVQDHFLEEHSIAKGRMTLTPPEKQVKILSTLAGCKVKTSSGGSAANTMHGINVLGGKTYYLGRVANDAYGRHYTEDMQNCGVGFPGPGSEADGTGTCVVLITPDAERTMLTHLGVSSTLHSDNVDETIVRGAKAVYIEGYLWALEETKNAALKLAAIAKKENIPVALTLSDAFIANGFKDSLLDFIRWHVDILFCNESEAQAMTDSADSASAFKRLQELAATVFLTLGKHGSWVGRSGEAKIDVKTFPVKAVDTTGAGDLYAAGALYGLTQGLTLRESAAVGSYCASQVVTHFGARMPLHAHNRVPDILENYRKLSS